MKKSLRILILVFAALLAFAGVASAQDMVEVNRVAYFIAPDARGVHQVFRIVLDGARAPRQNTFSRSDVQSFAVSHDGLAIAYVADGGLWQQELDGVLATDYLAPILSENLFSPPVYSADGDYLAYQDNGVWVMDLATRETEQILADVPLNDDSSGMAEFRMYTPIEFIRDPQTGEETRLLVRIGIWEWQSAGIFDFETGEMFHILDYNHTNMKVLYGERVLIYGNNALDGDAVVRLAQSLDTLAESEVVASFAQPMDAAMFADQAVEIDPGVVRVYGNAMIFSPTLEVTDFVLDIDLMTNEVAEIRFIKLAEDSMQTISRGAISPDGALIPVYFDADLTAAGASTGTIALFDLETGEQVTMPNLPETVTQFTWHP